MLSYIKLETGNHKTLYGQVRPTEKDKDHTTLEFKVMET